MSEKDTEHPIVFISYSQTSDKHIKKVVNLAQRLKDDGVDVVIDVWHLKPGHDLYHFMEKSVRDESVDKVLMICDKAYAEKANKRIAGVGKETMIISPEIYEDVSQEKFICLIFENDEDGKPVIPIFAQSRVYIDFVDSSKFEDQYEDLLRCLYNKPEQMEPKLGKAPSWLFNEEEDQQLSELRRIVNQIKKSDKINNNKFIIYLNHFSDEVARQLLSIYNSSKDNFNYCDILSNIDKTIPLRNECGKLLSLMLEQDLQMEIVIEFMEMLYNKNLNWCYQDRMNLILTENPKNEHSSFFFWELVIFIIAFLLDHEKYLTVSELVKHTFFYKDYTEQCSPGHIGLFYQCNDNIAVSDKERFANRLSPMADILISRTYEPFFTKDKIIQADVLIWYLNHILSSSSNIDSFWYPQTYVHGSRKLSIFEKLISKKFCEKTMIMYDCNSIEELKTIAIKYNDLGNRTSNGHKIPTILSSINLELIGSEY